MKNIKTIEKNWLSNFKNSELVQDNKYNSELASSLFYGFDEEVIENENFKNGFQSFNDNFDYSSSETGIDTFLEYLHFIGITISKESILKSVNSGNYSYHQILKKAFYLFKQLARYDDSLDINDPYHDNMGDLFFFLRIEEGSEGEEKQLTIFEEIELPDFFNKYIELPEGYENDKVAMSLFSEIENSNNSFFITGKAGTGKSTFIHYFTKNTNKDILLVAFTGIAAINIGGQTIHSFFRFPLKPLLPEDDEIPIFKKFYQKRKILEKVDTIIIDEVSMLRADILEGLDYSLRKNGGSPNIPFGGKQLLLVGDIFQLPPIVQSDDEVESELFKKFYESEYFFDSLSYKKINPKYFEFQKVHRQKNADFIKLLNKVRDCTIQLNEIEFLNQRFNPHFVPKMEDFVIMLTSNNYLAKDENRKRINSLPYGSFYFKANIIGDFKEDKYPTEPILELKRNSQVMFVKNDSLKEGKRWVNGTIAKVEFLDQKSIEIKMIDGSTHKIEKETWENRKYQWDKKKGKITSKVIGTFEQYPLKLAWAITIHKSQGLTFENVIIDLGSGAFANGQLYTALSRCRTLEGITLKRNIKANDIIEDKRLTIFYNEKIRPVHNIPKKPSENVNWDFLLKNGDFFNQLFSSYFPFNENELSNHRDIISIGSPYLVMDSGAIHCSTIFGLIFNKQIKWTDKLKELYYEEPRLLYAGSGTDEYSFTLDFDKLPLSFKDELESIKSNLHEETFVDENDFYDSNLYDTFYDYIFEKIEYNSFELIELLDRQDSFLYITNRHIYVNFLKNIKETISDFSINKFFEEYKNST